MTKKYYAVKVGKQPGIYNSWNECEKQVNGFSGAEYKKFEKLDDAKNFIGETVGKDDISINTEEALIAYVDGSYDKNSKTYGSGVVIINKEVKKSFSFSGNKETFADSWNIAGELLASVYAMDYCLKNNFNKLIIYFDYEGIEKWCTGSWKTKSPISKLYKKYYDSIKNHIDIKFKWVKGHSGNELNELADKLAKKGLKDAENLNTEALLTVFDCDDISTQTNFVLNFIEEDIYKNLISFLKKQYKVEPSQRVQNTIDSIKFKSNISSGDTLRINYYNSHTLTLQGKAIDIFNSFQTFLAKYKKDDFIEIMEQNKEYINYDIKSIEEELKTKILTKSFSHFNTETQNLLITSLGITKTTNENLYKDFSHNIIPIERCFEFFIKNIFDFYGIIIDYNLYNSPSSQKQNKIYFKRFNMFTKNNSKYSLTDSSCLQKITKTDVISKLELCYNFYVVRHKYAHSSIKEGTTKIISEKATADKMIIDGLNLLEESYKTIFM